MYDNEDVIKYYINKNLVWRESSLWGDGWVKKNPWTKMYIERAYWDARMMFSVNMSYNEFERSIGYERYYKDTYDYRRHHGTVERYWSWRRRHENNAGFVKRSSHKKKELSEDTIRRREWKKKVNKSKKNPNWKYKRKADCITKGNRAERRYVKTKLQSGDFGKHFDGWKICGTNGCYKEYEKTDWDNYIDRDKRYWASSWDWD